MVKSDQKIQKANDEKFKERMQQSGRFQENHWPIDPNGLSAGGSGWSIRGLNKRSAGIGTGEMDDR